MLKKNITFFVISAVLLISPAPSRVFAQIRVQTETPIVETNASTIQTNLKPDLKSVFAKELAKSKTDNLTEADFKRLEKERTNPAARKENWTKKEKTFLIVFGIGLAALVTFLIITPYKGPRDCNEPRPKDPGACRILFGN